MLSQRIQQIQPSPTLALAAKAKEMIRQGQDVISLTVGEPDWATYTLAKDAGKQAIDKNKTRYTPAAGIPELRKAISQLVGEQLGRNLDSNQVTVGSGAKYIIFAAFVATLDPGDEVIIPAPYWVSYPTMVELAGGKPCIVACGEEQDFKLTAQQLRDAIGPKTKMLLLNSPSNPTGAEYSEAELQDISKVLADHPQVLVLSDDIYNQLSFNERGLSPHLAEKHPELFDRCIAINGMSKAYSMTGWRIGWAVGPEPVIKAMAKLQSQTTGAPCAPSQWASVAAIEQCKEDVIEARAALLTRKTFFANHLNSVPELKMFEPQGAFYFWVNIQEWLGRSFNGKTISDSRTLAQVLLDDQKLAVVAGQEFGLDGFLRLSFAASESDLEKASQRLTEFAKALD